MKDDFVANNGETSRGNESAYAAFLDAFRECVDRAGGRELPSPGEIVARNVRSGSRSGSVREHAEAEKGAYAGAACACGTVFATLGAVVAKSLEDALAVAGWSVSRMRAFAASKLPSLFGASFRDASGFGFGKTSIPLAVCAASLFLMLSSPLPSAASDKHAVASLVAEKAATYRNENSLSEQEMGAMEITRAALGHVLEARFVAAADSAASALFRTDSFDAVLTAGEMLAEYYGDETFLDALVLALAARETKEARVVTSDWKTGRKYRDMLEDVPEIDFAKLSATVMNYGGTLGFLVETMSGSGMLLSGDMELAAENAARNAAANRTDTGTVAR